MPSALIRAALRDEAFLRANEVNGLLRWIFFVQRLFFFQASVIQRTAQPAGLLSSILGEARQDIMGVLSVCSHLYDLVAHTSQFVSLTELVADEAVCINGVPETSSGA